MGRFVALTDEGGAICCSNGLARFLDWSAIQICSDYYPFKVKDWKVSFAEQPKFNALHIFELIAFLTSFEGVRTSGRGVISEETVGLVVISLRATVVGVVSLRESFVGVVSLRATFVGVISLEVYGLRAISLKALGVCVFKFGGTSLRAPGAGVISRDNYKSHICLSTTLIK